MISVAKQQRYVRFWEEFPVYTEEGILLEFSENS